MFRPLAVTSAVETGEVGPVLTLHIDDPEWLGRGWTPLMPDHGKLMHMFLVRDEGLGAFAHIHPVSADSTSFSVAFPPLPPGSYRIYADIVQESGFTQTLVDTVMVAAATMSGSPEPPDRDPDDSWAVLPELGQARGERFTLPGGRTMTWEAGRQPLVDVETVLAFRVSEADGSPAALEPYMGMLSHAAVTRDDGSVFIHMHPAGSISMAAQARFERVERAAGLEALASDMPGAGLAAAETDVVSFPFVFPTSGAYRIFVQVKIDGAVETAVFDVEVPEE